MATWFFKEGAMTWAPFHAQSLKCSPAGIHIVLHDGHEILIDKDWEFNQTISTECFQNCAADKSDSI